MPHPLRLLWLLYGLGWYWVSGCFISFNSSIKVANREGSWTKQNCLGLNLEQVLLTGILRRECRRSFEWTETFFKPNFSEIDNKQVRSLISEILKDLLAKSLLTVEDSCSKAKMPERFWPACRPSYATDPACLKYLPGPASRLNGVAEASAVAFRRAHSAFRGDWERTENQFSRMICAATSSTPACLAILLVSSKICSIAAFEDSLSSMP